MAKNATLLHIASLHGATECVRTLLAAGADVDAEYGGLGGDLDQTKKKKGSTSKCSSGCTALVLATHSHHLGTMKALLNAGAGVGGATLKMPSTTAEQRSRNDIANAALYYGTCVFSYFLSSLLLPSFLPSLHTVLRNLLYFHTYLLTYFRSGCLGWNARRAQCPPPHFCWC